MNPEVKKLFEKSKRALNAAMRLADDKDYDFSVSRAYYSIFYASEALLLMKGKSYSKHSAVIAGIFEEFIKTGELDKKYHRTFHAAFDLRQKGDYMAGAEITESVARELIASVKDALDMAAAIMGD